MADLTDLSRAFVHSSAQIVVGSSVGVLLDSLFPAPDDGVSHPHAVSAAMAALEAAAQITAGAVISASFLKRLEALDEGDPAQGISYMLAFSASQPNLQKKIRQSVRFVREEIGLVERMVTGAGARETADPPAPSSAPTRVGGKVLGRPGMQGLH